MKYAMCFLLFLMVLQNVPSSENSYSTLNLIEDNPKGDILLNDREFTLIEDQQFLSQPEENVVETIQTEVKLIPEYNKWSPGSLYTTSMGSDVDPHLEFSSEMNATSIVTQDIDARSGLNLTANLTAIGTLDLSEVPIDYLLVLDESGSVNSTGWNTTIQWAKDFVSSLKPSDRVGIITFSTGARIVHTFIQNQSRIYITDLLSDLTFRGGSTYTREAIERSMSLFNQHSSSNTPKFLFLVTDGVPNPASSQNPCSRANQLKSLGISTLIIGVGDWDQTIISCLVEDPTRDMISVDDYDQLDFNPEDLSKILSNLSNTTAYNVELTLVFNTDINFHSYSVTPSSIVGHNVTWTIDRMKENESLLVSIILDLSGEGVIPVYTSQSTLQYQPVNQTELTVNLSAASVEIIVEDVVAPNVSVSPNVWLEAEGPDGTYFEYVATAYDLVDGDLTPVCVPSSGSTFPLGATVVTCEATDLSGNMGSASFTATVVDTIAPELILPADTTVEAESSDGTVVTFSALAEDIVDGDLTPDCNSESGSTFGLGTTVITCSATDSTGNTASGSFYIRVIDSTPPTILSPGDQTVMEGINGSDLEWQITDFFPDYYVLYLDDIVVDTDLWVSGDVISFNMSSLINGTYLFRLVVYDSSKNSASDEVELIVLTIQDQFEKVRDLILDLDLKWCKSFTLLYKLWQAWKSFEDGNYRKTILYLNVLELMVKAFTHWDKIDLVDGELLITEISILIQQVKLFQALNQDDDQDHRCHWRYHKRRKHRIYHH